MKEIDPKRMVTLGNKLYKRFCSNWNMDVMTPRTKTLIIFFLLSQKGEEKLLLKEMMQEFLTNLPDTELLLTDSNILYYKDTISKAL